MIIKKLQEPSQLRTPKQKRGDASRRMHTGRIHCQQHSTFNQFIQNSLSNTYDKRGRHVRRESREFTLGSLEKNQQKSSRRLSSLSRHIKSTKLEQHCSKHSNRLATHFVLNEFSHTKVYCENCSIELASRGWAMSKLEVKPVKTGRIDQQMDIFMNMLNTILSKLISRKDESLGIIKKCQTEFGRQIQQINEYFSVLQLTIEMEKNRQYTHVLSLRKEMESQQRKLCSIYENCIEQMNTILDNIVMMKGNISSDYDDIIREFSPRLQRYSDIVRSSPTKFTINPIPLNSIEYVQEMFHQIISAPILQDQKVRDTTNPFIMSKLQEDDFRQKTTRTEYMSVDQDINQDTNLMTQYEQQQQKTVINYDILKHLIE